MAFKEKSKNDILSLVPVRTGEYAAPQAYAKAESAQSYAVTDFSLERVLASIKIAESGDTQHKHAASANKAMELQHRWESLPVYTHDEHRPKRQLFSNFARVVNEVYGEEKKS